MKVMIPWTRQMPVTTSAVRREGPSGALARFEVDGVARGKNIRKRKRLVKWSVGLCGNSLDGASEHDRKA